MGVALHHANIHWHMSFLRHAIQRHEKVIQLLAYSLYILTNLPQQNYNVAVRNFDEILQVNCTKRIIHQSAPEIVKNSRSAGTRHAQMSLRVPVGFHFPEYRISIR